MGKIMNFTELPVKSSGVAPKPDATTEMTVVFDEAFHFTSAKKNGDSREDVTFSV